MERGFYSQDTKVQKPLPLSSNPLWSGRNEGPKLHYETAIGAVFHLLFYTCFSKTYYGQLEKCFKKKREVFIQNGLFHKNVLQFFQIHFVREVMTSVPRPIFQPEQSKGQFPVWHVFFKDSFWTAGEMFRKPGEVFVLDNMGYKNLL